MTNSEHPAVAARKALREKFGASNVECKRGSGTAYGWVEARVYISRPNDCACQPLPSGVLPTWGTLLCVACKRDREIASNRIKDAVRDVKFYTYSSDDGQGSDRQEFLSQVEFKK